jgi:acyl carrier protein
MDHKIQERVTDILVRQLYIDRARIEPHVALSKLGVDSLDLIEICLGIGLEFAIEVPEGDPEKFVTVGDVIRYVEERHRE